MPRKQAPAPLTPAEKKEAKANLKAALKLVNDEHGKFVSDHKAAMAAHDALQKTSTKAEAASTKAHDALVKANNKAIAAALKPVEAAQKKLDKATAAAEIGRAKIADKLAALDPAPATADTATA